MHLERLSIELTNRCLKGCWFCYNHSHLTGQTRWTVEELVELLLDCREHGLQAVSFGGGEPLEFEGVFAVLDRLQGVLFRSLTTHGLSLSGDTLERLIATRPDKVHVSIHFPERAGEVDRVIRQVRELAERGIDSGINLLVGRSKLAAVRGAAQRIHTAGIGPDRIVYLPMRGIDTPTPAEIAEIAGGNPFQSTTCLSACGRSEGFCSLAWDKTVAWCSYTVTRRPLQLLTYAGILSALKGLGLNYCGGAPQFPYAASENVLQVIESSQDVCDPSASSDVTQRGAVHPVVVQMRRRIIRVELTGTGDVLYLRWPDGAAVTVQHPAAHSMDVALHAIDRDGNVAILSAYLDEHIFEDHPEASEKFEQPGNEHWLTNATNAAINKLELPDEELLFHYHFNSQSNWKTGRFVAQPPPLNPTALRKELSAADSQYRRGVAFPWLSFDNAPVLVWPPQAPQTIKDWELLVDAANGYWLQSLGMLKHAERTAAPECAYWQTVSDRQWQALQQLERELERQRSSAH